LIPSLLNTPSTDEAMENMRETIEMCLEEAKVDELNKFIGARELEMATRISC